MTNARSLLASIARRYVLPGIALLALAACNRTEKQGVDSLSATAVADYANFSAKDFALLRWLEGDWRGQLRNGAYFYERYRFVDDSTIAMGGFDDSTFTRRVDSATIALRGGKVIDRGSGAPWTATRLDAREIAFARSGGANGFSWSRESADKWTATLNSAKGKPTVYHMERVRPK